MIDTWKTCNYKNGRNGMQCKFILVRLEEHNDLNQYLDRRKNQC